MKIEPTHRKSTHRLTLPSGTQVWLTERELGKLVWAVKASALVGDRAFTRRSHYVRSTLSTKVAL